MRSGGGYTLHQSLTTEAASMVKQSVNLARRRGHAQVTPLHVAISMLSSPTSLLKRACLKSHSHPLQCKALELCFNVALNRLPTSSASSTPLHVGPHPHLPSLSNALVAAFKRAQAHQRRGSIENQQQPILALKVEIEQLVISILDDPSVSRVMREAGFSSTQVKSNVEQSVSVITKIPSEKISTSTSISNATSVLEAMMNKKTRNTVIVCDSKAIGEGLVKEVIEKFDRRDVPSEMKLVQFISVPLFTLRNISKEEFEVKLLELRSLVRSYVSRGVVLYLGDLDRVSEFWSEYYYNNKNNNGMCQLYNPMEYMVMEISRLICGGGDDDQISRRVWLMGIATFQTYAKCKIGRPSLEILWDLYPLTISGSSNLGLGLSLDSGMHDEVKKERKEDGIIEKQLLVCCSDCTKNFAKEKCYFINGGGASCSSLPAWLQHYKDNENRQLLQVNNQKECDEKIKNLCKKWNSICGSIHAKPRRIFDLSPSSSSTSLSSSNNKKPEFHKKAALFNNWPVIFERNEMEVVSKPPPKPDLLSNPNSSPNSASSSEASGRDDHPIMELFPRNKSMEYSDSHGNILCGALEKKVPWQKRVIPDIVSTILKCRSGIKTNINNNIPVDADRLFRQESWLFFLGSDNGGKEAIARELAKTVFGGSQNEDDNFVATSSTTTTRAESAISDDQEVMSKSTKKRARDISNNENGGSVIYERLLEAVRLNPRRVFYVEDVDKLDRRSLKGFEKMMRDGSVVLCDGEVVLLKDAIVVLSCEKFVSFEEEEEEDRENSDDDDESKAKKKTKKCGVPLDLNIATEDGILDLVDLQIVLNNPGLVNSMC